MKHLSLTSIVSQDNPIIRATSALSEAHGRKKQGLFLVEGKRACETFLATKKFELVHLFIMHEHEVWGKALDVDDQLILVSLPVMNKISTAATPPGIVAVFKIPNKVTPPETPRSGIVLAQVSDPGNMGTLIRSAASFNQAIFVVEGVDIWSPKTIQASAGTVALAQIYQTKWEDVVAYAEKTGVTLTALVVADGTSLEQLPQKPRLLVVGNEAHGLPDAWINNCNEKVTLAMPGGTESLNAAVAGSIALYLISKELFTK
ncbi:MAG: tRNA/rRNA methyltransferase (SpoU) [candidate division TM6 bacterium GW2011_GWE2_42_60]|nr:MAG: tRNA/rRNA methyltransferase (SpoU) [candidate division TM6 bacterium GW2011_GWE2_42_60]HBY05663.1 hypothetical protein [Candidatus Dependentiae bacterium]